MNISRPDGGLVDLAASDASPASADISWKRVNHLDRVSRVSAQVKVQVIRFKHRETQRISLGMKQPEADPAAWSLGTRSARSSRAR
ncbi:MAG: hypothetical protein R3D28_21330 [Geminicoccaceae bacterium]